MENNISTEAYCRGGRQLLYGIVEHSLNNYVSNRVMLEKHALGIKTYQEKTLEKARREVEEELIFFEGEFMQAMYPSLTKEKLIAKLEKAVENVLETGRHASFTYGGNKIVEVEKPKRKRIRRKVTESD